MSLKNEKENVSKKIIKFGFQITILGFGILFLFLILFVFIAH